MLGRKSSKILKPEKKEKGKINFLITRILTPMCKNSRIIIILTKKIFNNKAIIITSKKIIIIISVKIKINK